MKFRKIFPVSKNIPYFCIALMKKSYLIAITLVLGIGFNVALSGCADQMTDRHSEVKGGNQGPMPAGVHDYLHNGTPANTDGAGQPLAAGKINTAPDTMWNQNSPLEGKPF